MNPSFETTRWSLVQAAGDSTHEGYDEALARLCRVYWPTVYAFVRSLGHDAEEARDLTQGFFAHLLDRKSLKIADPERGRFRSFLLASARNYVTNEWRRERREKRGGDAVTLSLDLEAAESLLGSEAVETSTPEDAFDRRWALSVLRESLERLRSEMEGAGKGEQFRLLSPLLTGDQRGIDPAIAEQLHMTDGALRVALHRLRRRFGRILREEVAETLADPQLLDDEMAHLTRVLSS